MCSEDFNDESYVLSASELSGIRKTLLALGPGPRLCVIKTFVNSWTTCRMGEKVDLPCFFCGEDTEDDLSDYLECDTLWTLLVSNANLKHRSVEFLSLSPSSRMGLLNPSALCFKLLAGAFLVYHALKFEHLAVVKQCCASGDFWPTHKIAFKLAEIHFKDWISDRDLT